MLDRVSTRLKKKLIPGHQYPSFARQVVVKSHLSVLENDSRHNFRQRESQKFSFRGKNMHNLFIVHSRQTIAVEPSEDPDLEEHNSEHEFRKTPCETTQT